jgi:hypothetical protein
MDTYMNTPKPFTQLDRASDTAAQAIPPVWPLLAPSGVAVNPFLGQAAETGIMRGRIGWPCRWCTRNANAVVGTKPASRMQHRSQTALYRALQAQDLADLPDLDRIECWLRADAATEDHSRPLLTLQRSVRHRLAECH